jgi:hypothetical protein
MAYEVNLETGEEVAAQIELNLSKKAQPFFFALSNRAIYIPSKQRVAETFQTIVTACMKVGVPISDQRAV